MANSQHLILASASPARLELLQKAKIAPDKVEPADIDETPFPKENPKAHTLRLAETKAAKIAAANPKSFVIAADTIVVKGNKIIGKAESEEEAKKTIEALSGTRHKVATALCIIAPGGKKSSRVVETRVKIKRLEPKEIDDYIASGEWRGKSGCYGLQGRAGAYIETVNGSFSSVIGLPMAETLQILKGLGYKLA